MNQVLQSLQTEHNFKVISKYNILYFADKAHAISCRNNLIQSGQKAWIMVLTKTGTYSPLAE